MITANQIIAHMVGDYIIQSDWMANEKTKQSLAAAVHAVTYTLPFLFITQSPAALAVILVTHFIIDRWRLARYVCWLKNFFGPRVTYEYETQIVTPGGKELKREIPHVWWHQWAECNKTGYHNDRPVWMSVWLMIIADNVMHILINGLAIHYLDPATASIMAPTSMPEQFWLWMNA